MFGCGLTRLQPAYVEDVAEAVTRALQRTEKHHIYSVASRLEIERVASIGANALSDQC